MNSCGVVKIADFGWSIHSNSKRKTLCGTLEYLPPEMVRNEEYDFRVDYWAIGVLTYEFLAGDTPFESLSKPELYKRIDATDFQFPNFFSNQAQDFIRRLLRRSPSERMTLEMALRHPWILMNIADDVIRS